MIRIEVFMATGCHLCPPAIEAAAVACSTSSKPVDLVITDIDGDVALEHRYRERIPVVEVDGNEIARFFVTSEEILAALEQARP